MRTRKGHHGGGIGRKPDQCDLTNHWPPPCPGAQLGLRGVTTTLGPSTAIIINVFVVNIIVLQIGFVRSTLNYVWSCEEKEKIVFCFL